MFATSLNLLFNKVQLIKNLKSIDILLAMASRSYERLHENAGLAKCQEEGPEFSLDKIAYFAIILP
jgi:hypothetical protein